MQSSNPHMGSVGPPALSSDFMYPSLVGSNRAPTADTPSLPGYRYYLEWILTYSFPGSPAALLLAGMHYTAHRRRLLLLLLGTHVLDLHVKVQRRVAQIGLPAHLALKFSVFRLEPVGPLGRPSPPSLDCGCIHNDRSFSFLLDKIIRLLLCAAALPLVWTLKLLVLVTSLILKSLVYYSPLSSLPRRMII